MLLDSRAWGEKWIANPFPYIEPDITKISDEDLTYYKKTFYVNLKKYQAFRDQVVMPEAYAQLEDTASAMKQITNAKGLPQA